MSQTLKIKKGDTVQILRGKDRGKEGTRARGRCRRKAASSSRTSTSSSATAARARSRTRAAWAARR